MDRSPWRRLRRLRFLVLLVLLALNFLQREALDLRDEWRSPAIGGLEETAASSFQKNNSNSTYEYQPVCSTGGSLWLDTNFSDWGQPHRDQSPTRDWLRIFVYDTLPPEFHAALTDWHLARHRNHTPPRDNFHADVAIVNLFETHPGRTRDPAQADLFVVPYLHAAHCLTVRPWSVGCKQVSSQLPTLMDSLTHYNETTQHRHLFVLSMDAGLTNGALEKMPLVLSLGPKLRHMQRPGAVVIPYLNDNPAHQPSCLARRPASWWTRPRRYAFTYVAGMNVNPRMTGVGRHARRLRREFKDAMQGLDAVGDLPYVLLDLHNLPPNQTRPSGPQIDGYYEDSVFCPALPGDGPVQKRFFDVMLSGCLPVVLSWDLGPDGEKKSWWMWEANGVAFPIEASYPFAKGAFAARRSTSHDDKNETTTTTTTTTAATPGVLQEQFDEIDYESFVVQVPGDRSRPHDVVHRIRPTLEALLADPGEIRRRQLLLQRYARRLVYGMGPDAHRRDDDAFAQILRAIRYNVL